MLNIKKKIKILHISLLALGLLLPSIISASMPNPHTKTHFSSPMEFAKTVYPMAKKAAKKLGVDPKVLVAQAAHETNWGKSVPKHKDGTSSFNLFGIKASKNHANKVKANTKEYINGKRIKDVANFRAYADYQESFMDYAELLLKSSRWNKALECAHDPYVFLKELQAGGYATDPRYAKKIHEIYKLKEFNTLG